MKNILPKLATVFAIVLSLSSGKALGAPVSHLFAFGDSNVSIKTTPPVTNGCFLTQYAAKALGVGLTSYAIPGATTGLLHFNNNSDNKAGVFS